MNDPVRAREALSDLSTLLQTHRLKFRDAAESAAQSFELLNNELEGIVAEEIYRNWTTLKDTVDTYLTTMAVVEVKVREQADQLSSF